MDDPGVLNIVHESGRVLGIGIATLINLFNPDMVAIGGGVDAAAATAIASARAAAGHVLLAPKRGAAVSAFAGVDFNDRFIDEFHGSSRTRLKDFQADSIITRPAMKLRS